MMARTGAISSKSMSFMSKNSRNPMTKKLDNRRINAIVFKSSLASGSKYN